MQWGQGQRSNSGSQWGVASPNRTRSVDPLQRDPGIQQLIGKLARQDLRGAKHLGAAQLLGSDWSIEHEMAQLCACFPESESDLKPGTDGDGAHISQRRRMGRLRSTRLVLIQL